VGPVAYGSGFPPCHILGVKTPYTSISITLLGSPRKHLDLLSPYRLLRHTPHLPATQLPGAPGPTAQSCPFPTGGEAASLLSSVNSFDVSNLGQDSSTRAVWSGSARPGCTCHSLVLLALVPQHGLGPLVLSRRFHSAPTPPLLSRHRIRLLIRPLGPFLSPELGSCLSVLASLHVPQLALGPSVPS